MDRPEVVLVVLLAVVQVAIPEVVQVVTRAEALQEVTRAVVVEVPQEDILAVIIIHRSLLLAIMKEMGIQETLEIQAIQVKMVEIVQAERLHLHLVLK